MQRIAILIVPFLLAGCAVPPALTIASFAADGVSYAATGKSTTDHALSLIAQEDCALLRAVKEEAICKPDADASASDVLVSVVESNLRVQNYADTGDF